MSSATGLPWMLALKLAAGKGIWKLSVPLWTIFPICLNKFAAFGAYTPPEKKRFDSCVSNGLFFASSRTNSDFVGCPVYLIFEQPFWEGRGFFLLGKGMIQQIFCEGLLQHDCSWTYSGLLSLETSAACVKEPIMVASSEPQLKNSKSNIFIQEGCS